MDSNTIPGATDQASADEIVAVTDIDQFAGLITSWHTVKVATLKHMLQVPEGTEVSIGGGPGQPLTGALLEGFKAGLTVALFEFETLPFVAEEQPQPAADPNAAASPTV